MRIPASSTSTGFRRTIDTGNNGELSQTGQFHTTPADLDELVNFIMPDEREQWGIRLGQKMDVVLYAHGGLVSEQAAANTASTWIGLLKDQQVFPIFFMRKSGTLETIEDEMKKCTGTRWPADRRTLGRGRRRGERSRRSTARVVAKSLWDQMKQSARLISQNPLGRAELCRSSG